jgi:hypothetical protein
MAARRAKVKRGTLGSLFGDSDSEGVLQPRAGSPIDGLDGKGCRSEHGLATVVHGVQRYGESFTLSFG